MAAALPDSYSFAEFTALAIPDMRRLLASFHRPCKFILSLGTGIGKFSRDLVPILGADLSQPVIIVAIDEKFVRDANRAQFRNLFVLSVPQMYGPPEIKGYSNISFYFVRNLIPTNYPAKTLDLRLRTYTPNDASHKKVLFGFADLCIPRADYPLNPLIPILQQVLDAGGKIIVQNEIYFYGTSTVEHNNSYYSYNSIYKREYPTIYHEETGRPFIWERGRALVNEHMQDLCEIPYIMRQLRPIDRVLYLDRGYLRPFVIESVPDGHYNNNSGQRSREAALITSVTNPLLKPSADNNFEKAVPKGFTPSADLVMLRIVTNKDLKSLKSLIRYVGLNRKFQQGWTYLHYAVMWNYKDGADFLIRVGIDINALSDSGQTALDYTYTNPSYFEIDMLPLRELLLAKGALRGDAVRARARAGAAAGGAGAAAGAPANANNEALEAAAGGAGRASKGGAYTRRRKRNRRQTRRT
jgi:hypothetical protein